MQGPGKAIVSADDKTPQQAPEQPWPMTMRRAGIRSGENVAWHLLRVSFGAISCTAHSALPVKNSAMQQDLGVHHMTLFGYVCLPYVQCRSRSFK